MNKSVEQRHAIQKGHRPMDQMEYQGIIWVIKADADKRIAELERFVLEVLDWSKAYPTDIFTEPDPADVDAVCQTLGFRIDRISAMVLREFTKPWGEKAAKLLKEGGWDGQ